MPRANNAGNEGPVSNFRCTYETTTEIQPRNMVLVGTSKRRGTPLRGVSELDYQKLLVN